MYNFEEFVKQVRFDLEEVLKNKYGRANVSILTARKVNCEMVGLACDVFNEEQICATIYMESMYDSYLEHGDMNATIKSATEVFEEVMKECKYIRNQINNFADAKSKIIFQLVHTEQNKELLETMPHREFMDLSIVYRCVVDISDNGILSAPINHQLADFLGLDEEELYELAYENTRYIMEPKVYSMELIIAGLMESLGMQEEFMEEEMMEQKAPLYVITNPQKTWGAAGVLYKGKLLSLAEQLESDLYLVPSSTHEMIITKAEQELLEVVESSLHEMNRCMDVEDRLSNEIYLYDRKSNEITQVTDSEHKMLVEDDGGMRLSM